MGGWKGGGSDLISSGRCPKCRQAMHGAGGHSVGGRVMELLDCRPCGLKFAVATRVRDPEVDA